MIKSLRISNYKSLGVHTTVHFNKLTVFVGQNGSGKSNIVDTLRFFSDCMNIGLEGSITKRHGIKAIRRWSSGKPVSVIMEIELVDITFSAFYRFEIASHKKYEYIVKSEKARVVTNKQQFEFERTNEAWTKGPSDLRPKVDPLNLILPLVAGDTRFKPLGDALRNIQVYSIFPDQLRTPQKYDPNKPMEQHGTNWISILKDQDESTWKSELISGLNRLTNEIDDFEIKQLSGYLLARFRHGILGKSKKAQWFDASQESDGTLRIAGIISALLQYPPLTLMGIEEPELTIHPGAISLVSDYIRQASKTAQIVLTTHSPELLDNIQPEDVRIVEKIKYITKVYEMTETDINDVKTKLLTLGDMHRTGNLKGQQLELEFD